VEELILTLLLSLRFIGIVFDEVYFIKKIVRILHLLQSGTKQTLHGNVRFLQAHCSVVNEMFNYTKTNKNMIFCINKSFFQATSNMVWPVQN
jgi:hypothetical protein